MKLKWAKNKKKEHPNNQPPEHNAAFYKDPLQEEFGFINTEHNVKHWTFYFLKLVL